MLTQITGACEVEFGLDADAVRYLRYESMPAQVAVCAELQRLDLPKDARILEIGSGYGILANTLAAQGFHVTALDFYTSYVDPNGPLARFTAERFGGPMRLECALQDLEAPHWGVVQESFDVVIGVDVIEHIRNVHYFMQNCNRALRPGGAIILHTPNYSSFTARVHSLKSAVRPRWPTSFTDFTKRSPYYGHIREFNHRELSALLTAFGFAIVIQSYPRPFQLGRLADHNGRVSAKRRAHFVLAEGLRKLWPWLSEVQLIVGRKLAGPLSGDTVRGAAR